MAEYDTYKGIGKSAEFKGLQSQYLFIFVGGLLSIFILFVILYMAGVNQGVCIVIGVVLALLLVWQTFKLNNKYGQHGLMKTMARKRHPRRIVSRKSIKRIMKGD